MFAVRIDGFWAKMKNFCNFLCGVSLCDKLQNFPFPAAESIAVSPSWIDNHIDIIGKHHFCNTAAQKRPAVEHCGNPVLKLLERRFFEHIPGRSRFNHLGDNCAIGMGRERHNFQIGVAFHHLAGGFNAVEVRHSNIHDDHVGV
jgi:hypothetical protein